MLQRIAQRDLAGLVVSVTGRLASMSHEAFARLVSEFGGQFVQTVSRKTRMLVLGQDGLPLESDGEPTLNLKWARNLQAEGCAIEVISEIAFLDRLGLLNRHGAVHRRYTVAELVRILGVSSAKLRSWTLSGLLEPVETVHRLAYYDFQQVATAKTLDGMIRRGLSPRKLRASLEILRGCLPRIERSLSQLAALAVDGLLLVRLANGALAEPTGQMRLEFDADDDDSSHANITAPARAADAAFEEALALEDRGDLPAAAATYQRAISADQGDPVLHFNLANVLFQLGDRRAAIAEFEQAVRLDPLYVEAWNNLGVALCDEGRVGDAIQSLRRALLIVPHFADARANLRAANVRWLDLRRSETLPRTCSLEQARH